MLRGRSLFGFLYAFGKAPERRGWEKVEHRLVWWGWANGGDVALYYPSCFIAMARIGQHTYRIQQCINTGTWHVRSPTEIKARASWPLDL